MLISLYSARDTWIAVPAAIRLPEDGSGPFGPLKFEGTVPSELIDESDWARFRPGCEEAVYSRIPEDLGLALLSAALARYGSLVVQDPP